MNTASKTKKNCKESIAVVAYPIMRWQTSFQGSASLSFAIVEQSGYAVLPL